MGSTEYWYGAHAATSEVHAHLSSITFARLNCQAAEMPAAELQTAELHPYLYLHL